MSTTELEAGRSTLQVLDFNVRASDAKRHDAELDAGDDGDLPRHKHVVDYPTRVVMPNIFTNVVESGFPYREVLRDVRVITRV